jgi:hypothetical protein
LGDAAGACIVSFQTDVLEVRRANDSTKLKVSRTTYSPDDEKIRLQGDFALARDIFGQEKRPKLGHVELEISGVTSTFRPSPVLRRFSDILKPDPEKPGLFIMLSSRDAPDDLRQCTFLGPLDHNETDSVVECVKFMKQNLTIDEPTRQTLLASTNPWLKELGAYLKPATAPAATTPGTTTKKAP